MTQFYVKPNFPGRCAHVCNGGFITKKNFRKQVTPNSDVKSDCDRK